MARILLVDDDQGSLDTVRRALELDGHRVTACSSGAEALAAIAAGGGCDALVTDLQMPGLDGVALVARMRAKLPGLPVVLISAHAGVLDKAAAGGLSGARFLAKPFTVERIRAEVRAALGG